LISVQIFRKLRLVEAGKQVSEEHWQMVEQKDNEWIAELPSLGMENITILPEEVAKLKKLSVPLWDKWAQKNVPLGPKVLEAARKALGI